jgi:CelD/BcsL family acetyltransferase involved in cellulose biosynthesis
MGTPTQGAAFFRQVQKQLPDHFDLLVVHSSPEVIGGGCTAPFRDTIYCTWSGILRDYYGLQPNYLLYWELLKRSCEAGFRRVDLGRSLRGSGVYKYKRKWGAEPRLLYQQFYLNRTSRPPAVGGQREEDRVYRFFVQVWRHLPLSVAEVVGPRLRRAMPFG